ncbi:MAG: PEGA domain-containing protein [Tenuifilaceae bacterium]|nr:PEGA domain-containing protein [Tenuifilaceae bacterium]
MKHFLHLMLILALTTIAAQAQINVKSFKLLDNDLDARVHHPKKDQNGEVCAIIKVVTSQTGFSFDVGSLGVVATEQKTGEVWVYVPRGVQRITISHQQLGVLRNYALPIPINSATAYEMVLVTADVEIVVREREIVTQWLAINSTPAGANVFIEERLVGTTPYTGQFPEGDYTYRIELPRYHPEAGKITLKGKRETLNFNLRPRFGNISVTSSPENGMMIYLNDENTGKTTPATIEGVISGSQTVKLISQWYQPQSKTVTVNDNQTTTASFTMEPAFASITVKTTPTADILINGTKKANGSYTDRMLTGIYTLKAELDKHYPEERQLIVEAGKAQNISLDLKPKTGRLDITSTPFDAKIKLNGKDYGTTPTTIRDLLIGNYTLTLEKQVYGTVTKTITIAEGKTTEINETLPSGMEVNITSTPSGAQLWVSGVSVGTTPYKTTLAFGSHSVKLVNGKMEINEVITITKGGNANWEYNVNENTGMFTDSRDGRSYKWLRIGEQIWMAENLAYIPTNGKYWAYDNNNLNVFKHGYLYDWNTARNVCPSGWHLPSEEEWKKLIEYAGSSSSIKLKSTTDWGRDGNGADELGFSATPSGQFSSYGYFYDFKSKGYWWSSSSNANIYATYFSITNTEKQVMQRTASVLSGFSVRCVKD